MKQKNTVTHDILPTTYPNSNNNIIESLMQEKRGVEMDYTTKMADLAEKCALELRNMDIKYKSKVNAESNRHKMLMAETEESHQRWNEENQALVER